MSSEFDIKTMAFMLGKRGKTGDIKRFLRDMKLPADEEHVESLLAAYDAATTRPAQTRHCMHAALMLGLVS